MTFEEYIKQLDNKILLSLSLPKELLTPSKLLVDSREAKREQELFVEKLSDYNKNKRCY